MRSKHEIERDSLIIDISESHDSYSCPITFGAYINFINRNVKENYKLLVILTNQIKSNQIR